MIPSKETDNGKSADLNSFDDLGRSSLGDVFSPVRDGKLLTLKFVKKNQKKSDLHSITFWPVCTHLVPKFIIN